LALAAGEFGRGYRHSTRILLLAAILSAVIL
jgi:hypothetical protein